MSMPDLYKETNVYQKNAIGGGISEAEKVANNYLSSDSTGIMVADLADGQQTPSEATGQNVRITNEAMEIRSGQEVLASYADEIQIGKEDESHILQDYHSWQMVDAGGNVYAYVSDLRDSTGYATVTDSFTGTSENSYALAYSLEQESDITSVTVDGEAASVASVTTINGIYYVAITPAPEEGSDIDVEYKTTSTWAKGYTFGMRSPGTKIGPMSFAEGRITTASGKYSHAEGRQARATGTISHAEGYGTRAMGEASHAEGYSTYAEGFISHAEGSGTHATGQGSHAEGNGCRAIGKYSHAQCRGTLASSDYQTAIGQYNIEDADDKYAFIVGNGTGTTRSNAFALSWSGVAYFASALGTGGKTAYNDTENTGVWLTSGGEIHLSKDNNTGGTIGFHYNKSASATTNLYEGESGVLQCTGRFMSVDWTGSQRTPATSANTDGGRVGWMQSMASALRVSGQWGTAGASFSTKDIAVSSSDVRLKDNIQDCDVDALDVISQLRMRQFDWKRTGEHQNIGIVADEVEQIDPRLVLGGGEDEYGNPHYKTIDDFYLDGYLLKGIQELAAEVKRLTAKVKDLEERLGDADGTCRD